MPRTDLNKCSNRYPGIVRHTFIGQPTENMLRRQQRITTVKNCFMVVFLALFITVLVKHGIDTYYAAQKYQIELQEEKTNGALPDQTSSSN